MTIGEWHTRNRTLIDLLETLSPDEEISIEVLDCGTGKHIALSYDISVKICNNEAKFCVEF